MPMYDNGWCNTLKSVVPACILGANELDMARLFDRENSAFRVPRATLWLATEGLQHITRMILQQSYGDRFIVAARLLP
jgi:hypothetical protein